MTQREEFEAWHAANYKQPLTKWSERYKNSHVQGRWQGWVAAKSTQAAHPVTPVTRVNVLDPAGSWLKDWEFFVPTTFYDLPHRVLDIDNPNGEPRRNTINQREAFEAWSDSMGLDELSDEFRWASRAWQAASAI